MRSLVPLTLIVSGCARPPPAAPPTASPPTVAVRPVGGAFPDHAPQADELIIRLQGPVANVAVELVCSEGYRERLTLIPDTAGLTGLADFRGLSPDACTIYFKGTAPARYEPVRPGQAYDCRLVGTTGLCEAAPFTAAR